MAHLNKLFFVRDCSNNSRSDDFSADPKITISTFCEGCLSHVITVYCPVDNFPGRTVVDGFRPGYRGGWESSHYTHAVQTGFKDKCWVCQEKRSCHIKPRLWLAEVCWLCLAELLGTIPVHSREQTDARRWSTTAEINSHSLNIS